MKIVGLLLIIAGWIVAVVGPLITPSTSGRMALALIGIALSIFGILGVLNKAHLKHALWKG